MAAIRGKDTAPELSLRKALSAAGLRFRKDYKIGRRRIDIAFPQQKVAVYVDGCFWHGCPKHYRAAKSNTKYWGPKIARNIERDKETNKDLRKRGWKVLRFWEHQIEYGIQHVAPRIVKWINRF
jgi:DNA mismatch endonuclease (patch repair protein)